MDISTLGAALNGAKNYVNSHFRGGSNIQIVDNPDGTQTINASGEVSAEDTVARADIEAIKDGTTIDSFGDVETELDNKVDKETGKGLSTNDYTTAEKEKLSGVESGADVNKINSIKVNGTTVSPDNNKIISLTIPTKASDISALPDSTKYAASLSFSINTSTFVMTAQLVDQNGDNLGDAQTIDLPLESVVVNGSYDNTSKKVVLTLQNGNTIEFSVADLVAGLQTELSASNKLNPSYIAYNSTHRAVTDTEKATWNGKQNALSTEQLAAVNSGITADIVSADSAALADLVNNGAKNILKNTATSTELNGVTFTVNPDGSVTATGTATANADFTISNLDGYPTSGQYVLSGCPEGGSINTYRVQIYQVVGDFGSGAEFTSQDKLKVYIRVSSGQTVNNLVFKPMICSKAEWDISHEYQPYAMNNSELAAKEQVNEAALIELVDDGAKNEFDINNLSTSGTYNATHSITGNTLSVSSTGSYGRLSTVHTLPTGKYVFSCKVSNVNILGGTSAIRITLSSSGSNPIIKQEYTAATDIVMPFELKENSTVYIMFYVNESSTSYANSANFANIMLCSEAKWDISKTYQPYRPSYQELYNMVLALQANS